MANLVQKYKTTTKMNPANERPYYKHLMNRHKISKFWPKRIHSFFWVVKSKSPEPLLAWIQRVEKLPKPAEMF